jgi:DNA processing protein
MRSVCDDCLRRTDLVAALAGRIDVEWRRRGAPPGVLALADDDLLALGGPLQRQRYAAFEPSMARRRIDRAGLVAMCGCSPRYPARLGDLADPPAVLHVAGDPAVLGLGDAVAIVGARRASSYGLETGRSLGRGLSLAGVPVVSGMALGIDSAAHVGALEGTAPTIAVLAGGADVPYPARKRHLHRRIAEHGAVVSELPPGFTAHRWCFVARNRIIAALSEVTVVVEATERSGSLTTADFALQAGRTVGAVPGPVTSQLSTGTNALLRDGAALVRGARDVLDLLALLTGRPQTAPAPDPRSDLSDLPPDLRALLEAVEQGRATPAALASTSDEAERVLRGLAELELRGLVRREFGGRYVRALPSHPT